LIQVFTIVESTYLNAEMCKFESSREDEAEPIQLIP